MRTKLTVAALLLLVSAAAAEEALESRSLLDGKVTMQVPASFKPMTDEHRKVKYPGANAPAVVMTDATTTVNVALDHKPVKLTPAQVKDLEPAMRQQLHHRRDPIHRDDRDLTLRIDGESAPVRPADVRRHDDRAARARRREDAVVAEAFDLRAARCARSPSRSRPSIRR